MSTCPVANKYLVSDRGEKLAVCTLKKMSEVYDRLLQFTIVQVPCLVICNLTIPQADGLVVEFQQDSQGYDCQACR